MPKNSKKQPLTARQKIAIFFKAKAAGVKARSDTFLARRPHRSFRRTRRRDYRRSLKLPGFFAFTKEVTRTLLQHKKTFLILALIYAIFSGVLVGIGSQASYTTLVSTLQDTGSQIVGGDVGLVGQAVLLFASVGSSGLSSTPSESQQIFIIIIGLLVWLTTIWLLRNLLAGNKVKLRDALYSAGAPIIPTFILVLVFVVQLIPFGIAIIGYSAANSSGLLDSGVAAMLFWATAGLLTIVSLYWVTSTFFAMVIVTLPGMYPFKALKTAGDMMVGRRLRFLLRLLWMVAVLAVGAIIILIPAILIDSGLTKLWPVIENVPFIPVVLLAYGVIAFIWSTSYIYLLYRKVIDDDAKPA